MEAASTAVINMTNVNECVEQTTVTEETSGFSKNGIEHERKVGDADLDDGLNGKYCSDGRRKGGTRKGLGTTDERLDVIMEVQAAANVTREWVEQRGPKLTNVQMG